ncbi:MAG: FAD-dependent oxidoreductase [Deltaproteobacteria bacterium]|nr:FAD-dependent oxidoreductase [Deltaproteobacteria bacterium]
MSEVLSFDTVVVGAGQAGPFLAAKLVAQGQKVALIEARDLGGTCVNRGCTPTKTLRKSARVAYIARRASEFGVELGPVKINFAVAMERMQRRVDESRRGLEGWLGNLKGLSIFKAHGRLAGREGADFVVHAGEARLKAPHVVLNTGTRPWSAPITGLAGHPFLDNESLLALRERPDKLVILGGGYISLEMAQIFRRLGSDVVVIERAPRLTAREDADVSAAITEMLVAEGIEVLTGVAVQEVTSGDTPGGSCVVLSDGRKVQGSHLLVATGRVPNTDNLGLDSVGLKTTERGYLDTNDRLETQVPGIQGAWRHQSAQRVHPHQLPRSRNRCRKPGRRTPERRRSDQDLCDVYRPSIGTCRAVRSRRQTLGRPRQTDLSSRTRHERCQQSQRRERDRGCNQTSDR